jgi:hypothetical protein
LGGQIGYETPRGLTFQAEALHRDEVSFRTFPSERFDFFTAQVGMVFRPPPPDRTTGFELGVSAGAGYGHGRIRGKLLYSDSGGCDILCSGPQSEYEPISLSDPILLVSISAGYQGSTFGIGITPHLYYARNVLIPTLPLVLRIRL